MLEKEIRDGKWRLIMDYTGTKLNLFDINADPYEQDDLSASYPEVVQKLKQKLLEWDGANPSIPDPACRMDE